MTKIPKVAVIGLGRVGFEFEAEPGRLPKPCSHVGCYLKEVSNLAVVDIRQEQLDKVDNYYLKQYAIAKFLDYPEMLDEFQPEIVSICTPTNTHTEIALKVADCSSVKSLFIEKPIAQSILGARLIIEACKQRGIKLTVNHQRRWDMTYHLVEDDDMRPKTVIGVHHGPILRSGIHMLDLFNWLINKKPLVVQAFGETFENHVTQMVRIENIGVTIAASFNDYNISGVVTYEGGVQAILISGSQKPYVLFELDILCGDERRRVTENGDKIEMWDSHPSSRYDGLKELARASTMYPHRTFSHLNSLEQAIHEVCVVDKTPSCSGEDGLAALKVALALHYSSTHENRIVSVDSIPEDYTVRSY